MDEQTYNYSGGAMRFINKISDNSKQSFILTGEAGERINFLIYFMPSQNSWFFDISHETFVANGIRLCCSPNLLRQFRNKISFGLSCGSVDGFDPNSLNDFTSGRVQIYTLSSEDVDAVESGLFS